MSLPVGLGVPAPCVVSTGTMGGGLLVPDDGESPDSVSPLLTPAQRGEGGAPVTAQWV